MGKEKIYENLAGNISLEHFKKVDKRERKTKSIITNILTLVICVLSITGMVFAKEISTKVYENFYGTGNGVGKAIEEGYIEKPEIKNEVVSATAINEDTGEKIEDLETTVKVTEFVMDDFTLSMTFEVEFSEEAKKKINPLEVGDMELSDMVIYDENNVILYCMLGTRLNEFCKEQDLDYNFETIPDEMFIGSGVNAYVTERTKDSVKMIYNIYTEGGVRLPKSKKLFIDLNKIKLSDNDETANAEDNIILSSNWNFSVDVPEKMYNRKNIIYLQKSTTNKDFKVTAATLYDTGMDISMEFKVEPAPEPPKSPELEFYHSLPDGHELKTDELGSYLSHKLHNSKEYVEYLEKRFGFYSFEKYLVNEKGEKFELTQGPRANGSGHVAQGSDIYEFNGMFDLTKYDMTDTITMFVDYKGNKAEIILEKVEE